LGEFGESSPAEVYDRSLVSLWPDVVEAAAVFLSGQLAELLG
jgi:hypothetical protein